MKSIIASIVAWVLIIFLVYNYIYLQWYLVRPNHGGIFLVLVLLVFFSFILSGSETAISGVPDTTLKKWHADAEQPRNDLAKHLSNPIIQKIRVIRPVGIALFSICYCWRPGLFVRRQGGNPLINRASVLIMVVILNNIINANITVMFIVLLYDVCELSTKPAVLPDWLPMAGSAGFTSIGASVLLVLLGEIVPKKLATSDAFGFLQKSSWLIAVISLFYLPVMIARGVEAPIDGIMDNVGGWFSKARSWFRKSR
jgi:hypothetical protein